MNKSVIPIMILSIIVFLPTSLLFAQGRVIQGKITTFDSIPVIGASIKVKSTKEVIFSDTLGLFKVSCYHKDRLTVTAKGFSDQKVKLGEKTKYVLVNLRLEPGPENRELAIGYGHIKDADKLHSISSLHDEDMYFSQYSDIYELIRGRFTGVQVINDEIIIRGGTSLYGSNAALLIVDGVDVNTSTFKSLPVTDIASINILKGPDASIYGVRGANGVVMVETKSWKNK
jgi:TonB-dependent SusC/RagA subfamily outer membrane receptor